MDTYVLYNIWKHGISLQKQFNTASKYGFPTAMLAILSRDNMQNKLYLNRTALITDLLELKHIPIILPLKNIRH